MSVELLLDLGLVAVAVVAIVIAFLVGFALADLRFRRTRK